MVNRKWTVILLTVAVAAGSLLYFYIDPAGGGFFPPCPFHRVTGFFCPGCGSQRAFHDLLHGNIFAAAGHNVLFLLSLPVILFAAAVHVNNVFRKKKITQSLFYSPFFARSVLALVLIFWVLRNIPAAPFNALSR